MEQLAQDLRFGSRVMMKRPGATLIIIFTLALGIGATTAIFSVVHQVMLRPLPYSSPEKLAMIWQDHTRAEGPATEWASADNFLDWRDQNDVFEGMFALSGWGPTFTGIDHPEQLNGAAASHNAFALLGIEPLLGRGFLPSDDTAVSELVVVLGYSLWQRRFGGSADVVGTSVRLDGSTATIIGVMPRDFDFPMIPQAEIFAPLRIDRTNSCGRGCVNLRVIGRLSERVTLEQARSNMNAIAARLEDDYPGANTGVGATLIPLHEQIVGRLRTALFVLAGAVGLLLVIACANVANILLARATARDREVATRLAMGASRGRLVRQMLTESLLLAVSGAVFGILWALWGVDLLLSLIAGDLPRFSTVTVDRTALAFSLVVAVTTGLVFGLIPALRATQTTVHHSLKEGSPRTGAQSQFFRSSLIVAEVALAVTLLIGAGLLMRSFQALTSVDPGFNPQGVVTGQLDLVGERYDEPQRRASFVDSILARVSNLPTVEGAGIVFALPLGGNDSDSDFLIEGHPEPRPGEAPVAWFRPASVDYFRTMNMRLVRGRWFSKRDRADAAPVVLINEAAARRYWQEDPVGERIEIGGEWRDVVGIVADTRHFGLDQEARPAMYLPYQQLPLRSMSLVVRSHGDPTALTAPIRSIVSELDSDLAMAGVATMQEVVSRSVVAPRVVTLILGVFAGAAVLLSIIGLYGVLSYVVGQRTRELGIRMALGASTANILKLVIGRGMFLATTGTAIGLAGAFAVTRFMESLLFETGTTDPATFILVPLMLAAVALIACYVPARRAAAIDPVAALHYE